MLFVLTATASPPLIVLGSPVVLKLRFEHKVLWTDIARQAMSDLRHNTLGGL
jgi:hypothetical protein